VFGRRSARRRIRRYRRHGLDPAAQEIVDFITERGVRDATVLEIGGGVGQIQVELLRRGASRVLNLEISTSYEQQAAELLAETGFAERVERRVLDIAAQPDAVAVADVVVLHRVVCCYPDYRRLLTAAGNHARRMLVFSHPPRNLLSRISFGSENVWRRIRRQDFRVFVHPPAAMIGVLNDTGLRVSAQQHRRPWQIVGLQR
jgi:magnesium-protoporphyrin O-methyltransferase